MGNNGSYVMRTLALWRAKIKACSVGDHFYGLPSIPFHRLLPRQVCASTLPSPCWSYLVRF